MPAAFTYPGAYVEEIQAGGARPITAVPTSITAFVGTAGRGPTDAPRHITSFAEFERLFGRATPRWPMAMAVQQFYLNGGSEAEIVRLVPDDAVPATFDLEPNGPTLEATSPGEWGNRLRVRVEHDPSDTAGTSYDLIIRDTLTRAEERYAGISTVAGSPLRPETALRSSAFVRATANFDQRPDAHVAVVPGTDPFADTPRLPDGVAGDAYATTDDGTEGTAGNLDYVGNAAEKTGLNQLLKVDIFNLLCVLPQALDADVPDAVLIAAAALCLSERAFFIVDPLQAWAQLDDAVNGIANHILTGTDAARSAAIYFPRARFVNPLPGGNPVDMGASGALAGVFARTDSERGVWKAPAGLAAGINGAQQLTLKLSDLEQGRLNRLGVNVLRQFPTVGRVVWGARTMRGADALLDDPSWRYVPIRRLALNIEESLYRGTQFVVFEPNDEPLWSAIRLSVGAFMNGLFRQGAFQGRTPREAYLVKCDKENNPQADIDRGIVNILVGFAPLKPAEFVYIRIQQLAGQIDV